MKSETKTKGKGEKMEEGREGMAVGQRENRERQNVGWPPSVTSSGSL